MITSAHTRELRRGAGGDRGVKRGPAAALYDPAGVQRQQGGDTSTEPTGSRGRDREEVGRPRAGTRHRHGRRWNDGDALELVHQQVTEHLRRLVLTGTDGEPVHLPGAERDSQLSANSRRRSQDTPGQPA